MYDSVDPAAIPADAAMVAGYVDGIFGPDHAMFGEPGWDAAAWDRFPAAMHVGIAVISGTNAGQVGDVESGDMTPAGAVSWVTMRRLAGADPSLYVSAANQQDVIDAFNRAGVMLPHFWLAHWDDVAQVPDGAVAKQYANSALSGGNFDLSVVADYWPGVDTMVRLDPTDPAYIDLQNRLGGLQAFIDPGGGATSTGELTLRVRSIDQHTGVDLPAALADLKAAVQQLAASMILTPAQAQQLADISAAVARLEAGLRST